MSIGLPPSSGTFISIAKRRTRTKPIWPMPMPDKAKRNWRRPSSASSRNSESKAKVSFLRAAAGRVKGVRNTAAMKTLSANNGAAEKARQEQLKNANKNKPAF